MIIGWRGGSGQVLFDSGSNVTLIPKRIGDRLYLPQVQKGEIPPFGGIVATLPIVFRIIEIEIGNYRLVPQQLSYYKIMACGTRNQSRLATIRESTSTLGDL